MVLVSEPLQDSQHERLWAAAGGRLRLQAPGRDAPPQRVGERQSAGGMDHSSKGGKGKGGGGASGVRGVVSGDAEPSSGNSF